MNKILTEIKKEQFVPTIQKFLNKVILDPEFENVCKINVTYDDESDRFVIFLTLDVNWVRKVGQEIAIVLRKRLVRIIENRVDNYLGVKVDVNVSASSCGKKITEERLVEDVDLKLKRRLPKLKSILDSLLYESDGAVDDLVEESSDEFDFADEIIEMVADQIASEEGDEWYEGNNYEDLINFIKDSFGMEIIEYYYENKDMDED